MNELREIEALIIKLQAGEITQVEHQRLQELIKLYPDYQPLLKTHNLLIDTARLISRPEAAEFKGCGMG